MCEASLSVIWALCRRRFLPAERQAAAKTREAVLPVPWLARSRSLAYTAGTSFSYSSAGAKLRDLYHQIHLAVRLACERVFHRQKGRIYGESRGPLQKIHVPATSDVYWFGTCQLWPRLLYAPMTSAIMREMLGSGVGRHRGLITWVIVFRNCLHGSSASWTLDYTYNGFNCVARVVDWKSNTFYRLWMRLCYQVLWYFWIILLQLEFFYS